MRSLQLSRACSGCVLLLAALPGCQVFYQYRPMPVLVRDAETKQPVASADVHISYPLSRPEESPWESAGVTGRDGVARLRAAPYGLAGVQVDATATGYMAEQKSMTVDAVRALAPGHLFESTDQRAPCLVVELYAAPQPSIELIVPTGYRGLVKATIQTDDAVKYQAGQRDFGFNVSAAGTVEVNGPTFLQRVKALDVRARYVDGTPLDRHAEDPRIGFWWLRSDGDTHYYLVGTHTEYEAAGHFGPTGDGDGESSGSKKSQGKGRRGGGRSGGQSSQSQSAGGSSGD